MGCMRDDLERRQHANATKKRACGYVGVQRVDGGGRRGVDGGHHVDKRRPPGAFPGARSSRRARRERRATRYSRTTLTRSCAVTSGCKRTGTVVSPSVLIGSSSCTRRRSSLTPCLSRKSTRSCEVTEPKSLPSSDAWRRSS